MPTEQGPKPNPKLEILTGTEEEYLRSSCIVLFKRNFLKFQEFDESITLFQTDLVRDKGRYAFIFQVGGADCVIPYEMLDLEFIDVFERFLEDPDQKPHNSTKTTTLNKTRNDMPDSLKDYFEKSVLTFTSVYFLRSSDDKIKSIRQTVYVDPLTHDPIAEVWRGIVEKPFKKVPQTTVRRIA